MGKTIDLLIIDDHPLIINAYIQSLKLSSNNENLYDFTIVSVTNIEDAVKLIDNQNFSKQLDLIFLDISLPKCNNTKMISGEDLGLYIRSKLPGVKIMVITLLNDDLRLINIIKKLNPDGLLIKSDVDIDCLWYAVKRIIKDRKFYSTSIQHLLNKRIVQNIILDDLDFQLLIELSNGAKMKELEILLPLTKSGIDKRKRVLRDKLGVISMSDRDLVLTAKEKGFL